MLSNTLSNPRELLTQPHSFLLWGRRTWHETDGPLLLHTPARVLEAASPSEVPALLEEAQGELDRGRYVAGLICYEAGAAFDLAVHPPSDLPPVAYLASFPPEHVIPVAPSALLPQPHGDLLAGLVPELNVSREQFHSAIAAIKQYIAEGDTYQVNYTCHAAFEADLDPLDYFLALVRSHPVPYAAFLNLGDRQVLSLSPELLLSRRGDLLESRPMKGTRRRGRTMEEDEALVAELVASPKDRAENLMIVDMVRHDLGRVCRTGSVQVPALFTVEKYRTLWQMTSTVRGTLAEGVGLGQIIAAVLPGSSVTGAPKRRTMEIIRELEPAPRGVYCGALGLFAPGGDFTCNLPIRTLVHRAGQFDLGIGSGIVWDSDPESEYRETLLKSQFAFNLVPDLRLYETLRLTVGREYAFLEEHLARLARSAEYWDFPFDEAEARRRLAEVAGSIEQLPFVVRMDLDQEGGLHFTTRPVPEVPTEPVRVLLSNEHTDDADRFLPHKTNRREFYDRERARALEQGCYEVIFCNQEGRLTEGAVTNLFVRLGDRWLTPPVSEGLLPGLWREQFMREVGAVEEPLPVELLEQADEILLGNSVRGAIAVGEVVAGNGACIAKL